VTRAAKRTNAPYFAHDPVGAVLAVLRSVNVALGRGPIIEALVARGADQAAVEKAWPTLREQVRFDPNVVFDKQKYQWTDTPRAISLEERIYQLTRTPDPSTPEKLMALMRDAMIEPATDPVELAEARRRIADAERRIAELQHHINELSRKASTPAQPAAPPEPDAGSDAHAQYERAEKRRAARERQARIDAMSTVAELAAEVEELTAKKATPEVLLEHTRALTNTRGLEPIGTAGAQIPYAETQHEPVGDFPNDGDLVTVIRPGYLWHAPGEAVLISKALVTRAKGVSGT
jgi:hypothetical protein